MSASSPTANFIANIPGLLSSGAFSDLTLTCGGKEFKVHKVVLCTQSPVFRKLLDGKFKENGATDINLPEDEPRVLQVLIHFFYNFALDTTGRPTTSGLSTFLVHVYAIADKYDVGPLRALAAARLNVVCDPVKDVDDFIAVLRVTDACTVEKTVWNILLPKAKSHISFLLRDKKFRELVIELPILTYSLLALLDNTPTPAKLKRKRRGLEDDDSGWITAFEISSFQGTTGAHVKNSARQAGSDYRRNSD